MERGRETHEAGGNDRMTDDRMTAAEGAAPSLYVATESRAYCEPAPSSGAIRMVVQTREGALRWNTDEWTALVAVAALTDEPQTFAELSAAVKRYLPRWNLTATGETCLWREADLGGGAWCLIDLRGQTLVTAGGWDPPDPLGAYQASEGEQPDGFPAVWLCTPWEWTFVTADGDWRGLVERRAAAAADRRPCDYRAVLYGEPLLAHLLEATAHCQAARESVAPCEAVGDAADDTDREDAERLRLQQRIHAEWLMTPREDLGGRTPRELVVREAHRIDAIRHSRKMQWIEQGEAPPPLPVSSYAYRFGGMGIAEAVLYFSLVRHLLDWCWREVAPDDLAEPQRQCRLEQMAAERDRWLDAPLPDGSSRRTVSEVIELERTRMPQIVLPEEFDCTCPLCADMAASPVPTFVFFDSCELDMEDKFVFSLAGTRAEWEQARRDWSYDDDDLASANEDDDDWSELFDGILADLESQAASSIVRRDLSLDSDRSAPTARLTPAPRRKSRTSRPESVVAYVDARAGAAPPAAELAAWQGAEQTLARGDAPSGVLPGGLWRNSQVDWDALAATGGGGLARLAIGFPLAEFVGRLKEEADDSSLIQQLNASFVRFRAATEPAEIRAWGAELARLLEQAARCCPALVSLSADLQSRIDEVLRCQAC